MESNELIVTIDGPAGAGKSSIAKELAERLGYDFLDTGAMYRAVTLGAIRNQVEWGDTDALVHFASQAKLRMEGQKVFLDDDEVTDEIRSPTVTAAISHMADIPEVRKELSRQQRQLAEGRDIVTDGRDQGSEVFPEAACKVFLTASPEVRAKRRQEQLTKAGRFMPLEEILVAQNRRDDEDARRPLGALRPADDAIIVDTDRMTPTEVLAEVLRIVELAIDSVRA